MELFPCRAHHVIQFTEVKTDCEIIKYYALKFF